VGGHDLFGVGIRNDLSGTTDFYIEHQCDAAYARDDTEICNVDVGTCGFCNSWLDIDHGPHEIAKNDILVVEVFAIVPNEQGSLTAEGTYQFNVRVCTGSPCTKQNQYGNTKKININAI